MSKKFRLFYETAFDSKTSKSDENLLSDDKQDLACRFANRLHLSASTNSVQRCANDRDDGVGDVVARNVAPSKFPCKNRLFAFLLRPKKRVKYRSTDSMVTSSSLSLESIATSDSLSSHSSESPRYCDRFQEPHVLSPISDKSSQDAIAEISDLERRKSSAAALSFEVAATDPTTARTAKAKPPQSLGLIKLNRDQRQQHHGSDSGISVGSKPGDNYQELLDVPFDMPKLRRKQKSEIFCDGPLQTASDRPSDATELMRVHADNVTTTSQLPFDMPKLRKRQIESNRAKSSSFEFEIGKDVPAMCGSLSPNIGDSDKLEELPFDIPKLKKISLHDDNAEKKPDRSNLFLDVKPCIHDKPSLKTLQNKNQPNRPTLSLTNIKPLHFVEDVDTSIPLDQQCWYHGYINRLEAERLLYDQKEGSYLVRRNLGSYALSIRSAKGYVHMRITQSGEKNYLGESDRPFDTIPDLIRHYSLNKLPAKGIEHVGLIRPLAYQML